MPTVAVIDTVTILSRAAIARNSNLPSSATDTLLVLQNLAYELIVSPLNKGQIDNITISQTIEFEIIKSTGDLIMIGQSIGINIDRDRLLTSTVNAQQTLVGYIDRGVSGNSGDVFIDPAIVAFEASLTPVTTVSFTGLSAITLRKPSFGDTNTYEQIRVQRNTLGGGLEIYRDSFWPDTTTFTMTFDWLSQSEASLFQALIEGNLGRKITFLDHFGQSWLGYLSSPEASIVQPKVVGFTINVTFQVFTK